MEDLFRMSICPLTGPRIWINMFSVYNYFTDVVSCSKCGVILLSCGHWSHLFKRNTGRHF